MSGAGLEIIEWKPLVRNSLRGFATVRLRNGLSIADVSVHSSHGKSWASLPSKPVLDREGMHQRDRDTGKGRYVPILSWPNKDTADRFSAAVIEALAAAHPRAMEE